MKISIRTSENKGTAIDLFKELLKLEGDQLLLSTGYLTSPELLPADEIVRSVSSIALADGRWEGKSHNLAAVKGNAAKFVGHLRESAARLGKPVPELFLYAGESWHSKVAIKRIAAAIIGSSNVSKRSLGGKSNYLNHEVDIMITEDDGDDAKRELEMLYKALANSLKGHFKANRAPLGTAPAKASK
jgi:hypothetical protein